MVSGTSDDSRRHLLTGQGVIYDSEPRAFFGTLSSLLADLVWGSGHRRVALTKIYLPLVQGGLGASQYELYYAAVQIHWILRWLQDPLSSDSRMVNAFLGHSNVLQWLFDQDGPPRLRNTLMNVAGWVWRRDLSHDDVLSQVLVLYPAAYLD
ncbi:hypothetical protein NDU88_008514 [Pleurodeles waltl]|uniref:Uncharacterized protein n=1 Tax=Pleurodeles waltl TaxID=8319 RepID=A0AAV7PUJ6_PLEWA|nr:hypothetical protein NDU88_008514 [Pleurodeles waltl]